MFGIGEDRKRTLNRERGKRRRRRSRRGGQPMIFECFTALYVAVHLPPIIGSVVVLLTRCRDAHRSLQPYHVLVPLL